MQVSSLLTCRCVGSARVRARRVCASPGLPGRPQCLRALTTQPRRACLARVGGGDEGGGVVEGARKAWRTAEPLVETLAEALPSSVPLVGRKAGVVLIGGGLSFWALKSLLNTAFTLVLLLLLAFVAWTITQSSDGEARKRRASGTTSAEKEEDGDETDPLAEARRIMSKYK